MQTTAANASTESTGTIVPLPVRLLLPRAAARLAGVTAGTLRRQANAGKVTIVKTIGGHARYREDEMLALRIARTGSAVLAAA